MAHKQIVNGKVYYRVQINRKGIKVSKLFEKQLEAIKWQEETKKAIDNGYYENETVLAVSIPNISQLLEEYYLYLEKKNTEYVAYKTSRQVQKCKFNYISKVMISLPDLQAYEGLYGEYIITDSNYSIDSPEIPIGLFRIDRVDNYIIERYIEARKEQGLKSSSIYTEISYIKAAFNKAYTLLPQLKLFKVEIHNPFEFINKDIMPKSSRPRKKVLSDKLASDIAEIFKKKKNIRYYLAFIIAIRTGLRKSEILSIKYSNVDFTENTITLPITKNGEPRTVLVDNEIIGIIQQLKQQPVKFHKNTPLERRNPELIFNFDYASLDMRYRNALDSLNIPKEKRPVWHSLKNTAISNFIKSNGSNGFSVSSKFNIRQEHINERYIDTQQQIIDKIRSGIPLTEKEISVIQGGHKDISMTERYFVDKED